MPVGEAGFCAIHSVCFKFFGICQNTSFEGSAGDTTDLCESGSANRGEVAALWPFYYQHRELLGYYGPKVTCCKHWRKQRCDDANSPPGITTTLLICHKTATFYIEATAPL